jgi:hypothetical protein
MNEEIILDKLRKMLFTTQKANECGLSNNDFKEDIYTLSGAIGLIENLIQRNKDLEQIEQEHKEENGRLRNKIKELEEIDLTTVYMDGYYDGMKAKIIKDKNAKTIEIKKIDIIEQKDKIIDLMARAIDNYDSQLEINTFKNKEHIIDFFTNKAEEDIKE